jgi:hypothetical protein
MDKDPSSPNRGDKMRRVADIYAQLTSLKNRKLLSDAQRQAATARLKLQLKELLSDVWK